MTEYEHVVYGVGSALIRNPDGSVREATPEELKSLQETYNPALERSFVQSRTHEADEPGHVIEGHNWPYLNLGPHK